MINGNIAAALISRQDQEYVVSQKSQLGLAEVSGPSVMWRGMRHRRDREPPQDEGDRAAQVEVAKVLCRSGS